MPGPDRVQVTKIETGTTGGNPAEDFTGLASSVPIEAQEDAIESAGHYFQDAANRDEEVYIDRDGNDLRFRDSNNTTPLTLTDLASGVAGHEDIDSLVHCLAEDAYTEPTYGGPGGRINNITTWTDVTKTTKIRECQITYSGALVSQQVQIQYNAAGVEVQRITETIAYIPGTSRVLSVTAVETP
jgi:hypothetical protein